jgi:hypothetical protein
VGAIKSELEIPLPPTLVYLSFYERKGLKIHIFSIKEECNVGKVVSTTCSLPLPLRLLNECVFIIAFVAAPPVDIDGIREPVSGSLFYGRFRLRSPDREKRAVVSGTTLKSRKP